MASRFKSRTQPNVDNAPTAPGHESSNLQIVPSCNTLHHHYYVYSQCVITCGHNHQSPNGLGACAGVAGELVGNLDQR